VEEAHAAFGRLDVLVNNAGGVVRRTPIRDAEDALKVTREWDERGVALHLLDLRVDTASPVGRVFLTLLAAFAEWERSMISERISIAMQHLLARGVRLGAEPLGRCRAVERDRDGRRVFVEVEDERETVDRIHELRSHGMSLRGIALALEAEGRRPKRSGSRWSPSVVRAVCARGSDRVAT
jgi:DNA invertase Pin-like site-specific DNA recombinase